MDDIKMNTIYNKSVITYHVFSSANHWKTVTNRQTVYINIIVKTTYDEHVNYYTKLYLR